MAFLAACPFCRRKVQAPDSALGSSIACKKCGNYFTLAPADDLAPPPLPTADPSQVNVIAVPPQARVQRLPTEQPALGRSSRAATTGETVEHVVATTPEFPRLQMPAPSAAAEDEPAATVMNVYAAATLALGALAVLCAAWSALQWATIPVAAAGFLAGVICMLATPLDATRDRVLLALGGIGSVAVLLLAFI